MYFSVGILYFCKAARGQRYGTLGQGGTGAAAAVHFYD